VRQLVRRWLARRALRGLPAHVSQVTRVTVGPTDAIVIEVDQRRVSPEQIEAISRAVERVFPGIKVLILDASMKLSVVGKAS
jgi:hypothetical protein